jgi:ribonuclease P protein component
MRPSIALAWAVGRVSREVAAFLSILSFAIESAAHHVRSRGGLREAHLPTEQSSPRQEARLPPPDEHPRRASRAEGTSRQGPAQPVGLIWRIRERSAFTRLANEGRRTRAGVLWCTYIPDPVATPPRVAYALGRAIGPAVVRNRLRRRLRAMLTTATLPPGFYLIGAQPTAVQRSRSELEFDLLKLVASVGG